MRRKAVCPGDIAMIPIGKDRFVPARVVYLSMYFKDIVLLELYLPVQHAACLPDVVLNKPQLLVYTSQESITTGEWTCVGRTATTGAEVKMSRRIVAGAVWEGDVEIAPATDEDYRRLPEMRVMGAGLVEKKAREIADGVLHAEIKGQTWQRTLPGNGENAQ